MTDRIPATRSPRNPHDHIALATGDIAAFERLFDEPDSLAAVTAERSRDAVCCWLCDEEPAYHDDEPDAFERSRDLDVLLGCL